ncbi:AIPR family protein [Desulfobacterales bacterium HSG16]|nr:AIPR family protein [Desulfobacterales bacterium HSG16]
MTNLHEFHEDFLQSILSDAESRGLMKPQAFFENVCEELLSIGDLTKNYTVAEYTKRGIEVHGYDFDEERKIVSLLVHQFFQEEEIQTLTKNTINVKFNRLKAFFSKCTQSIYQHMEETSEAYSMAYNIHQYHRSNQIDKARLIILTDGRATRNLIELPSERIGDIEIEFRVVDIEYLYKIYLSESTNTGFEIDVDLPCLKINAKSDGYESYLSFLSGPIIAEIYDKFGQKLFEQNVRTFLQFRGNVNKGLRNTIEYVPEMFFAYNNGITATASSVDLDKETKHITKIRDFQIVNGGQTTSAIYAAQKKTKADISAVAVQMKLSVVKHREKQDEFVSKVAEYANTQNKINKSDFFSNSPFHKEMKNYSKRIWVAAIGGSQRRTHWFYERVRGEYLNEQAYLTKAERKKFQLENPKQQLFDKTFLSKSENAWMQKPDVVSKGAQYSFSKFAKNITDKIEEDNLAITESFFKDAVARVILFRSVEKMVSRATWYNGGFRAQTVAYTIAYLSFIIDKTGIYLNFDIIWKNQCLPHSLVKILECVSKAIYYQITTPPEGFANISQWAKQNLCWQSIQKIDLDISIDQELLINKEQQKYNKRKDKKNKKIDNSIEIQAFVVTTDEKTWKRIFEYYQKHKETSRLSPMQMDILRKKATGNIAIPSEKQSKILYKLYKQAESEGINL